MKIAEFSLNHPTLPPVSVKAFAGAGQFYVEEWNNGEHVRDHYFPACKTERDIKRMARELLMERRREAL